MLILFLPKIAPRLFASCVGVKGRVGDGGTKPDFGHTDSSDPTLSQGVARFAEHNTYVGAPAAAGSAQDEQSRDEKLKLLTLENESISEDLTEARDRLREARAAVQTSRQSPHL